MGAFMRNCVAELLAQRGEVLPVDSAPLGAGHLGIARRIPYGVVAAITPFNAPANLLVQNTGTNATSVVAAAGRAALACACRARTIAAPVDTRTKSRWTSRKVPVAW